MFMYLPKEIIETYCHIARRRSHLYKLLKAAYCYPEEDAIKKLRDSGGFRLLDKINEIYSGTQSLVDSVESFKKEISLVSDVSELQAEYARIFMETSQTAVPLYEFNNMPVSDNVLGGNLIQQIKQIYLQEGLSILAELEFMSYLTGKETLAWEKETGEIEYYLVKQDTFLSEHMTRWIPQFARKVQEASRQEFYRILAQLTEDFIALDYGYLKSLMNSLGISRR